MRLGLPLIGVLMLASACASGPRGFVVVSGVRGLGSKAAPGKFVVLPGIPGTDTSNAQFREVRRYVARVLEARGFQPAQTIAESDVAVFARYGIGAPQQSTISRSSPVMGWIDEGAPVISIHTPDSSTFQAPVPGMGRLGVVGFETKSLPGDTIYQRWLVLNAVDAPRFRRDGSVLDFWRTSVVSTGRSSDLRLVLPYMVVSAAPYVGQDTRGELRVLIDQSDKRVKALQEP